MYLRLESETDSRPAAQSAIQALARAGGILIGAVC
jgi:hypothetical protein